MSIFLSILGSLIILTSAFHFKNVKNEELQRLYFSIVFYTLGLWVLGISILIR